MRGLLLLLLALLGAVALTVVVKTDPGYMLMAWGAWTVETTIALFALAMVLLFIALYATLRTLLRVWHIPERMGHWNQRRKRRKARRELDKGLIALAEGRWKKAETTLARHAAGSDSPMVYYLAAARAAQQQHEHPRRDKYLQQAHESMPGADIAVALTQAELQMDHGQLEQALATLRHLHRMAPKHPHVLKLLALVHQRLGDWEQLNELMPSIRKYKAIDNDEREALELTVFDHLLRAAHERRDDEGLKGLWTKLPRAVRQHQSLVLSYTRFLIDSSDEPAAETLLRDSIRSQWNEDMVYRYGLVNGTDPARQLANAEEWLEQHERSSTLLLSLGRLCLRNRLWGKARSYFEASIGIQATPESCRELGSLLESLGDSEAAMLSYRQGIQLASGAFVADQLEATPRVDEDAGNDRAVANAG